MSSDVGVAIGVAIGMIVLFVWRVVLDARRARRLRRTMDYLSEPVTWPPNTRTVSPQALFESYTGVSAEQMGVLNRAWASGGLRVGAGLPRYESVTISIGPPPTRTDALPPKVEEVVKAEDGPRKFGPLREPR